MKISAKLVRDAIREFWLIMFNHTWHRWSIFIPAAHFSEQIYYEMWAWVNMRLEVSVSSCVNKNDCLKEGINEAERLFLLSRQNQRQIVRRQELLNRLHQIEHGLCSVYREVPDSVHKLNIELVLETEKEPAKQAMARLGVRD